MSHTDDLVAPPGGTVELVTVTVGDARFGLPIGRVHDVFKPDDITPVPLAPPEVIGLLNLRGRVVTAIALRRRLALAAEASDGAGMAVGLEQGGETFALMVDNVGEVLSLGPDTFEAMPANLAGRWRGLARGVHRLPDGLLTLLDIDGILAFGERPAVQAA